ncbi:pyridoxamine 5'-phosphate oxidase family protein, partial [Mycobacterium colombiense]|uniref:pyridoxamine 5'-phosphate oxidase family protein n=1 Tax=Mycobacterium colombiense TaxID=339268 RepID=UPI002F26DF02
MGHCPQWATVAIGHCRKAIDAPPAGAPAEGPQPWGPKSLNPLLLDGSRREYGILVWSAADLSSCESGRKGPVMVKVFLVDDHNVAEAWSVIVRGTARSLHTPE